MHAIDDVGKIKLRNRDVSIHKKGGNSVGDAVVHKGGLNPDQPSSSQTNPRKGNEKQKGLMAPREVEKGNSNVREFELMALVELGKTPPMFNLQNKLSKLKISIPFTELLRNHKYRDTITTMIENQGEAHPDILELTEGNPTIILGSKIDSVGSKDEEVHPFI